MDAGPVAGGRFLRPLLRSFRRALGSPTGMATVASDKFVLVFKLTWRVAED